MTEPAWRVRPARPGDRDLLKSFTCADPTIWWQVEVENFVRTQLLDWAFDPHAASGDPRALLAFVGTTAELFGVAAHERIQLEHAGSVFAATKVEVIAVAADHQGRRFPGGERASDVIMSAVLADVSARVPPRAARVLAVIHQDNVRSLAMCHRHGLVEEMSRPHPDYRRLVTAHRATG